MVNDGKAVIEKGCIVIRIPVDNLKVIVEAGPHGDVMQVTDTAVFAADLVAALNEEAEDGTTRIHKMIDQACLDAFEDGADGVEELDPEEMSREIFGRRDLG